MPTQDRFTTQQAADILGLSRMTLCRWRRSGIGPPWVRVSERKIIYPRREFYAWVAENRAN
ncbi:helix-turn-helix domain-containing protein [Corynebacterium hindlerae]|uniref:Helix-turn-helix domain-containing protein n=2 Tax=Corynebacterium hindlerae TaxID=699041 RepID=A0A7G5FIN9_9CORY|nr:helix-turn-helix domain-containing protein [Corynebacterium hindlerae]